MVLRTGCGISPGTRAIDGLQLADPCPRPVKVAIVLAECGDLSVPENPVGFERSAHSLRVARVPAINRRKQPDPLFVLAGGPGMARNGVLRVSCLLVRANSSRP